MKVDILAIGAHPDDVELSASGTILKHIAAGKTVGILDLTKGELGTLGDEFTRADEARNSLDILGAMFREQVGLDDGFFQNDKASLLKVIEYIRLFQPAIVLANAPDDRHPDHGRAARLVSDACFYSGLKKIETIREGKIQDPWRPRALYHYIQDRHLSPDFVVDITAYMEQKIESIMAFKTQFYNPGNTAEATPIAQKNFIDSIKGKNAVFGRSVGVDYAEGFICSRIPGVKDLFDLM